MCKNLFIKGHIDYTIFSQLVPELSYKISPPKVTTHPGLTLLWSKAEVRYGTTPHAVAAWHCWRVRAPQRAEQQEVIAAPP